MTDHVAPDLAAFFDQEDARTADQIRRFGVSLQMVGGGGCSVPGCCNATSTRPFGYTIGLFGIAHPELVVVGLHISESTRALNAAARTVLDGGRIMPGIELAVPGWSRRFVAEAIPNPGDIAFSANWFYQRPPQFSVPLLQLSYPDRRGRFPSDPTYSGSRKRQPRPGEWDALT
jgi:hypothetical protein